MLLVGNVIYKDAVDLANLVEMRLGYKRIPYIGKDQQAVW